VDYKLFVVRIFVSDWDRALRFYSETLEMEVAFRSDEMGWAQLNTGEAQLALERVSPDDEKSHPPGEGPLVGRFVGVSLSVPDIQERYKILCERGVEFEAPPERMPWGGVMAHLRDPDGNILTLLGE
jgi:catechol 2,3-dioxygenase-like lactoylglutathione lyase family enzyme